MAHRMTTLHEEPLRTIPLKEENEDSYSDPECDYDNLSSRATNQNDYYAKSNMRSSYTIDSFMDIDKKTSMTSTNLLNYRLLTQNQNFNFPTQSKTSLETTLKSGKASNAIPVTSPSMNSSTSSGYGSQAVSINNLANDDTLSLQSISVDENTPGEWETLKLNVTSC